MPAIVCGSGVKTSGRGKIILLAPKVYVGLYGARVKKRRPKMLKRSIIGITVVALLACIPQVWAGGDKSENWGYTTVTTYDWKEVYRVDIKVKVPWWIKMQPQDPVILYQVTFYEDNVATDSDKYLKAKYEGHTHTTVIGNYKADLSTALEMATIVTESGGIGGVWTSSIVPNVYDPPLVSMAATITVTGDKVDMSMKTPCETLILGKVIVKVRPVGITTTGTYVCP